MFSLHLHRYSILAVALLMLCASACNTETPPSPVLSTAITPIETSPLLSSPSAPISPTNTQAEIRATPTPKPQAAVPTPSKIALQNTPQAAGPQLAFIKAGDIWLLDDPGGEAYQLTLAGDIMSFAWSPDGERLAAYNGKSVCFFQRDGSIRTSCLTLGLDNQQSKIERNILWSPDQSWIVLWNSTNPWDEDTIGWLILALDTTNAMWRIQDPVDWGATLSPDNEPGGVTGQPIFLSDGRLIGTLTHRYLCASGGCRYQLFEFELQDLSPKFAPFPNNPEEGWSEGANLLISPDGKILTNYGAFLFSCDSYQTFIDQFNLDTTKRETYNLEQQSVVGMNFSPDQKMAILARTAACGESDQTTWNKSCGLSQGFEVLSMQLWSPDGSELNQLVPGTNPIWSPDGELIAFTSCLQKKGTDIWLPDPAVMTSVFLTTTNGSVTFVSEGSQPSWRPR